jgi:hypothetical protein
MSAFGAAGAGPNPTRPEHLTPKERRAEVCRLLALGLIRLRARESSEVSDAVGESSLHNSARQSGHANCNRGRPA